MIFRNPSYDNNHNTAAPADVTLAGLYRYCGVLGPQPEVPQANFIGTAIGPKLVCIADHIGAPVGTPFLYQGQTYSVVNRIVSAKTGAAYLFLDRAVPNWASIWREESYSNQSQVFYVGHGMGRGTEILSGATVIGWNAAQPYVTRWAVAILARLEKDPGLTLPTFACYFENPLSECAGCVGGDSAGGCFLNTPAGWRYLGPIDGSFSDSKVQFDTTTDALRGDLILKDNAEIDGWNGDAALVPPDSDELQSLLTRDLNALIHGPSIYDEARFEGVSLRTETKALIGKELEGDELIRFNRMLLEDAYPLELKRSLETDVPAGEEPGESARWTREYLILPNCTNGIFVNNRLLVTTSWIPNGQFTSGGYGAKRDFIAASYVLDYTRYSPKNEFRINQGSADELQSLLKIGDSSVVCLKSQSVGLLTNLTGDSLQSLSLEMIIRKYGVANPRAATEVGRDAVFVSPRRGVVSLRQTEQNKIQGTEIAFSDPIRQWIEQIDWTLSHKIRVEYWNDALYVSAPVGSSESYSLNWLEGIEYLGFVDFRGQPYLRAGMTIRWDPAPDNSEWFIANGQTFKARTQLEWDGKSVLGVQRVRVDDAPMPSTSSMRRVYVDVNTAVLIYDYQTGQWQPIDRGVSLSVREWFVATVDGIERLCAATEDGYLNLYEESDAGDQVFNPNAPNFLSFAPIAVEGKTRGYTGGSAGFKAGQFARLVLATRAPRYSVETGTEGVSETSKLVTDQTRDRRIYDRPAGVKRWKADNANHDFFTPWRRDYSVVLESEMNPLNLSTGETLDLFTFLSLDLSPHPIGFDLGQGTPVDLMQEANHSLRLVRQRGRWHQALVSNSEGIFELRAVELQLQETSRQVGIKV